MNDEENFQLAETSSEEEEEKKEEEIKTELPQKGFFQKVVEKV